MGADLEDKRRRQPPSACSKGLHISRSMRAHACTNSVVMVEHRLMILQIRRRIVKLR
jgi:hypothetical protein